MGRGGVWKSVWKVSCIIWMAPDSNWEYAIQNWPVLIFWLILCCANGHMSTTVWGWSSSFWLMWEQRIESSTNIFFGTEEVIGLVKFYLSSKFDTCKNRDCKNSYFTSYLVFNSTYTECVTDLDLRSKITFELLLTYMSPGRGGLKAGGATYGPRATSCPRRANF